MNKNVDDIDYNFARIASARLILTPNNRLAESLREYLCERLAHAGEARAVAAGQLATQIIPTILPFQSWVSELCNKAILAGYSEPRRILSSTEESIIWQEIIGRSSEGHLLSPALAAAEAQRAYQLLQDWSITIEEHAFEFSSVPDCAVFYHWQVEFMQQLEQRGLFTRAQAQANLLKLDERQLGALFELQSQLLLAAPDTVPLHLLGFNSLTPLQQQLLARVEGIMGSPVGQNGFMPDAAGESAWLDMGRFYSGSRCKRATSFACDDFESELYAAAQWANAAATAAPAERIAIVVPALASQKNIVERVMREVFSSAAGPLAGQAVAEAVAAGPDDAIPSLLPGDRYNISAGRALAKLPLVEAFLQVVESALCRLTIDTWQHLLYSPYLFASAGSLGGRNLLLQAMYRSGEQEFKLDELPALLAWYRESAMRQQYKPGVLQDLPEAEGNKSSALAQATEFPELVLIRRLRSEPGSLLARLRSNKAALPSQWLEQFRQLLELFKWPGGRGLNSDEFQQQQAFIDCCDMFWQVDTLAGEVNAVTALSLFRQQLQNTVYHKQTVASGGCRPVQVLGALEASGQLYDRLWLTGFSEHDWPARPASNALIPFALQARLQMPGASEQREFAYARKLTQSLLYASKELSVSYTRVCDGIESQLAPVASACLQASAIQLHAGEKISSTKPGTAKISSSRSGLSVWETIADTHGRAYPALLDEQQRPTLQRGVAMLQDYARNPFIAYARHRLEIEPLPRSEPALSALERGIVLHTALEACWRSLDSSAVLKSQAAEKTKSLVSSSVASALQQVNRRRYKPLGARLVALQQQVFERLLHGWLLLEQERPDFNIKALEQPCAAKVGDYYLSGRIDRIDSLANGEQLFIDYKSGSTSINGWLDERLSSPQLPFYYLASQAEIAATRHAQQPAPALAFACLKAGEVGFKGLADEGSAASEIEGVSAMAAAQREVFTNSDALLGHWRSTLQQRSQEIATGFAAIDLDSPAVSTDGSDPYEPLMRARAAVNGELYGLVAASIEAAGNGDE